MKKNKLSKIFVIFYVGLLITSCSDFLDRRSPSYDSDGFYETEAGIRDGVVGVYNCIYMDNVFASHCPTVIYLDHFTGLCVERNQNTTIGAGAGCTPDDAKIQAYWSSLYTIIARANAVIYGASKTISNMSDAAKQYYSEAKVLRAYAYYNLISTWGDVPFFTEPVTVDEYEAAKVSKVKILDFVIEDLEDAANYLPWMASERGRVDKAVAYGLEARAALLGGSLNYDGKGSDYLKIAAESSGKVIGKRHLAANYSDLFTLTGQAKSDVRDEMLWELMYSSAGTQNYHWVGLGQASRNYGQSGRHPTSLLADTYECIDGKRIDKSPLYDPKHPNRNRDPRFEATLRMHNDTVDYYTTTGVNKVIIDAYATQTKFYSGSGHFWFYSTNKDINSTAAWTSFVNAGCGYLWQKYTGETTESLSAQTCNIAVMRYAEILLTYAEAKIELGEFKDQSVYDAINAVRNRAGMPSISSDKKESQDKMRQLVRRERKVELIMEGLHFVDMRRWGIGDLENEHPCYGIPLATIKYEGMTDIPNYVTDTRHDLNDIASYEDYKDKLKVRDANRYWDSKFALWPIPQIEIDRDPNIIQNDGYK